MSMIEFYNNIRINIFTTNPIINWNAINWNDVSDPIIWNIIPIVNSYTSEQVKESKKDLHLDLLKYIYHPTNGDLHLDLINYLLHPSRVAKYLETHEDVETYLE
jgi:hypothetical protein